MAENSTGSTVLVVDLDGTLIRTDLLYESIFALLKKNVLWIFLLPVWLCKGKAGFKAEIAARADINVEVLPYNEEIVALVQQAVAGGRQAVLATAANIKYAQQVATFLGLFAHVLASDDRVNMSGRRKLHAIRELLAARPFAYAGDSPKDVEVWQEAAMAYVVNPSPRLRARLQAVKNREFVEAGIAGSAVVRYLKAIRLHQWLKNSLLFVPLLTAHEWSNPVALLNCAAAFLAMGFCASSIYIVNDLLDLESDRCHYAKRTRPFAAGTISMANGLLLHVMLLAAGLIVAWQVSLQFLQIVGVYLAITMAYSLVLKRKLLIDTIALAGLYTLRVIAGAVAIGVEVSFWLLAFSMFMFLSLALVKRYTELADVEADKLRSIKGRAYKALDTGNVFSMGVSCGYISVLVLALFINDPDVASRYTHARVLWLLCVLILYWISRIWMLAGRNEVDDDPIVFALKDTGSRYVLAACIAVVFLAL